MQYQSIHLWRAQRVAHADTLLIRHARPNIPRKNIQQNAIEYDEDHILMSVNVVVARVTLTLRPTSGKLEQILAIASLT